jgi:hypothetical protein
LVGCGQPLAHLVIYFNGLQNFYYCVQLPGVVIGSVADELEKKTAITLKMILSFEFSAQKCGWLTIVAGAGGLNTIWVKKPLIFGRDK